MKNTWYQSSDDTIMIALRRGGRCGKEFIWAMISPRDFKVVDSLPGTWVAKWNETAQTFYARNNRSSGWKPGYMHRVILGVTDPKVQVDHHNHNGLDNRRNNITSSTVKLNGWNRRGAERGSYSGRRNVYWNQREKQYMVWFV